MAKKFGNMNPLDKLSGNKKAVVDTDTQTTAVDPVVTVTAEDDIEYTRKGKVKEKTKNGKYLGRKQTKTEATKTINIAVPLSVIEKLNIVKVCYGNNLTQYINKLIEKDIEANFDTYQTLAENLSSFNN